MPIGILLLFFDAPTRTKKQRGGVLEIIYTGGVVGGVLGGVARGSSGQTIRDFDRLFRSVKVRRGSACTHGQGN